MSRAVIELGAKRAVLPPGVEFTLEGVRFAAGLVPPAQAWALAAEIIGRWTWAYQVDPDELRRRELQRVVEYAVRPLLFRMRDYMAALQPDLRDLSAGEQRASYLEAFDVAVHYFELRWPDAVESIRVGVTLQRELAGGYTIGATVMGCESEKIHVEARHVETERGLDDFEVAVCAREVLLELFDRIQRSGFFKELPR